MTDEERQKLIEDLRDPWRESVEFLAELAAIAADEIERMAKQVAYLKDENGVIREQCQNMLDTTVR